MFNTGIAIYGAGFLGKFVLENLKILGVKPLFFIDKNKKGMIEGIPIYSPENINKSIKETKLELWICVGQKDNLTLPKNFEKIFSKIILWKNIPIVKLFHNYIKTFNEKAEERIGNLLRNKNIKIFLTHSLGGGTEVFLQTLLHENSEEVLIVRSFPFYFINPAPLIIEINKRFVGYYLGLKNLLIFLTQRLHKKIKVYFINLVSHSLKEVKESLKECHYFFTFFLHDYFCICPNYNLINFQGQFCGPPENILLCNQCLIKNIFWDPIVKVLFYREFESIERWRETFKILLTRVEKIICFSEASRKILLKVYPYVKEKVEVKPHQVTWVRKVNKDKKKKQEYRVAVLGELSYIKGAEVILKLAEYLKKQTIKDLKIFLFGKWKYKKFLNNEVIKMCGAYKKENLSELMEQYDIDLIFIPSLCPETFCYTAEEAVKTGLPVAVFNIGAPAERIKDYKKGILLDYNKRFDAKYVYIKLKQGVKSEL